jgi:hypothetical protein
MTTTSRLRELGIPALEGQAALLYHIGTAAMTFAVLLLFVLPLVGFSQGIVFSFSWIVAAALLVIYACSRVNPIVLVATAVVLVVLTFIASFFTSPITSLFSLILFAVCLVGGWFLRAHAAKSDVSELPLNKKQLKTLLYAPLACGAFISGKLNLIKDSD